MKTVRKRREEGESRFGDLQQGRRRECTRAVAVIFKTAGEVELLLRA